VSRNIAKNDATAKIWDDHLGNNTPSSSTATNA